MMIIYCAKNKINNKIYIGKTVYTLSYRIGGHLNFAYNQKSETYFHRAIRKYGIENFEWSILCNIYDDENENKLSAIEKLFIAVYKKMNYQLYNMTEGGDGTRLFGKSNGFFNKKHSDETKAHLSITRKGKNMGETNANFGGKYTRGENNPFYGRKHSDETKKKISENHMGKNYGVVGENHPMFGKTGKLHPRSKAVYQIDKETNQIIKEWESISLAEKGLKIKHISGACYGKFNIIGGYKWKFKNS